MVDFTSGKLHAKAKGNTLYKCDNWNLKKQECNKEFELVKNIFINETYTAEFNRSNVAFIETVEEITNASHSREKDDSECLGAL